MASLCKMSGKSFESRSPQRPEDVVGTFGESDVAAAQGAITAAQEAGVLWAATPAPQRAAALEAAAGALEAASAELAELVVREVGKPVAEAGAEVARGVGILRYHAQAALDPDGETYPSADGRSWLFARRRPRGVAGLVTPWNFPVAIPLWKAAPALAYGNSVVLKPSPEASAVAVRIGELLSGSLPQGVLQVVTGGAEPAQAIVAGADVVSFTGSVATGRSVVARATGAGVPTQAEMGGQNASIVLAGADVEAVADVLAGSAMAYAGQKCTATSRVIVEGDPRPLTEAVAAAVDKLPVGDPSDRATVVGPVITEGARDRVLEAAAAALRRGARIVTGGGSPDGPGWFVSPTVIDGVAAGDPVAQEEVFGPICVVLPAASANDAVRIANGVAYGLVTSVFTPDLDRAMEAVAGLDTGLVRVNAATTGVDLHAPFGGEKASSFGPREQGKDARQLYTRTQTTTVTPPA